MFHLRKVIGPMMWNLFVHMVRGGSLTISTNGVGRKNSRGTNQKRSKNSTIKLPSTLSVPCMKIQGSHGPLCPPMQTSMIITKSFWPNSLLLRDKYAWLNKEQINIITIQYFSISSISRREGGLHQRGCQQEKKNKNRWIRQMLSNAH